ncbi:uncharacterized protein LOC111622366 isoform X2 [Centruroides sculpturatus]|uniref:uncharacterized protein LOC111622366 isoform X2 n=1 Tax=Centruroides sculpturatus TaxID=218467 RepID=UPI000C6EFF74|nr:uncharacterized protein LOC111622366 isoform X2 [Centruroides sculpturatus]
MKIKEEPSDFTFEPKCEVPLNNCKKEFNTEDEKFCKTIKSEPLEYGGDEDVKINIDEKSILANNRNLCDIWNMTGYDKINIRNCISF